MNTKIISNSNTNIETLISELESHSIENLIINLTNNKLTIKDINLFLPLSKSYKKQKKSFVIVTPNIDFNKISDKITVVPTLQEAHDIIEIEEIERDLKIN